ncbi:MAG: inositol monophosphatase family protein [Egibacteraceae bacterium]
MSGEALVDLAVRAARAAGAVLLERSGHAGRVDVKTSATDPVSDADRASEALLIETILGERPDDGLLGEEGARRRSGSGLRWVIDPLDGTVNYLYRHPGWAVSVGCEEHGEDGRWRTLVGVVHNPLAGETFRAFRGAGAWLGERRLRINDPVPVAQALVATGFSYVPEVRRRQGATVAALLPQVRDIRRVGSASLDLCSLAAGRVDAYYEESLFRWDWAAGALIAAEAGAVVDPLPPLEGEPGVIVVAAGPFLHSLLRALLSR